MVYNTIKLSLETKAGIVESYTFPLTPQILGRAETGSAYTQGTYSCTCQLANRKSYVYRLPCFSVANDAITPDFFMNSIIPAQGEFVVFEFEVEKQIYKLRASFYGKKITSPFAEVVSFFEVLEF